jgi:hypothetical protein
VSWFHKDWPFRIPITIVNTSGGATLDISGPFPRKYSHFWDTVLSTGFDIRVTESDGETPITFANGTCTGWDFGPVPFSVATKTFTLRIDGWNNTSGGGPFATVDAGLQIWLYWGNAAAADARDGAVALVGPETAIFATRGARSFPKRFTTALELPGQTTPTVIFQKTTTDIIELAWDFRAELAQRDVLDENHLNLEELRAVEIDGGQGTTSIAPIRNRALTRFVRENVVITRHTAGQDKQNYWLEAKATTSLGQVLTRRIQMNVRNTVQS